MKGLVLILAAFALVAPLAASSGASRAVSISGFAFSPATLSAEAGDTVTWTNRDSATHTVTCDAGSCAFGSGSLTTGASFATILAGAGTQRYHCNIHTSMHGSLFVGSGVAADADLAPDAATLSASRPLIGGVVPEPRVTHVSVTVRNAGGSSSSATSVEFHTTDATGADALIGSAALGAVPAGGSATVGVDWANAALSGDAPVRVVVDPANAVIESAESNDEASRNVHVGVV